MYILRILLNVCCIMLTQLPITWCKCYDGAIDCRDLKSSGKFGVEQCIGSDQVCDKVEDCTEGEDEDDELCLSRSRRKFLASVPRSSLASKSSAICHDSDLKCGNGRCVSQLFSCDGNDDCGDSTDEKDCPSGIRFDSKTGKSSRCRKSEIKCPEDPSQCILKAWKCDGKADCPRGTDEWNCSCDGYRCSNGLCIASKWRCDGYRDCSDGADELGCVHKKLSESSKDCLFWCKDGSKCLPAHHVCDHEPHCDDESDEKGDCDPRHCQHSPCEHSCLSTPEGPRCYCDSGYQLTSNSVNCSDINECDTLGWCSQQCINSPGGYECHCRPGYAIDPKNNRTCIAMGHEPLLLLAAGTEIRGLYLRGDQYYFQVHESPREIISLSFDGVDSMVYWSTATRGYEGVYRKKLDGTSKPELVASGLSMPEGIAVDWVGRNVYITDALDSEVERAGSSRKKQQPGKAPRIIVCSADGAMCHVLISNGLQKPRAIVLHPEEGILFWSDWGSSPRIVKAGMDGTEVYPLVTTDVTWPNGLAIDYPLNDLYWVDAKLDRVEAIHIDGHNRRVVLDSYVRHPFSLSVFEDTIYWSDWSRKEIRSCNKFTGKDRDVLVKTKGHLPMGIHVHHPVTQNPVASPCWGSQCSHLCVIGPGHTYKCVCPLGFEISDDSKTCRAEEPQEHIILSADNELLVLTPQEIGRDVLQSFHIPSLNRIGALDFDQLTGMVIASDVGLDGIYAVSMKERAVWPITRGHMDQVEGLVVDSLGRNVYWVDALRGTVEVARLPRRLRAAVKKSDVNTSRAILVDGLEHPTDLAIVPLKGLMFVSTTGDHSHIDSFTMDGKNHKHLVEINVGHPVSLCSDDDMHRIFWTDAKNGVIESVMWDGSSRIVFKQFVSQPFDIEILGRFLYWTDVHSKDLHWTSKFGFNSEGGSTAKAMMIVSSESVAPTMMKLTSVSYDKHESAGEGATHGCIVHNGGCEHICIPMEHSEQVCLCPTGMSAKVGNSSACTAGEHSCGNEEFRCTSGKCIPKSWRCDGREDCKAGEDEVDCLNVTRKGGDASTSVAGAAECSTDFKWECADGACIPRSWLCDGNPDCPDGSDERGCPLPGCSTAQFQCASGQCITRQFQCDGDKDCKDGSDEENCTNSDVHKCLVGDFRCSNGQCIAESWKCDKVKDCNDGSDEINCSLTCTVGAEFRCPLDNLCISPSMVCDGKFDCPQDGADESTCRNSNKTSLTLPKGPACRDGEFRCSLSSICIPSSSRCDGNVDCPEGSEDEIGCCGTSEFSCSGGRHCIHESWVCDGHPDCADGADETWSLCTPAGSSSAVTTRVPTSKLCLPQEFQCYSGDCVSLVNACDGHPDCKDGSDEGAKCNTSCKSHGNPCAQACYPTPEGPVCRCLKGYYLMDDGVTCDDVDECEVFRQVWSGPSSAVSSELVECSQYCSNTKGSYKCTCADSYRLDADRATCRLSQGHADLLVATPAETLESSVQIFSISAMIATSKTLPLAGSGVNITAIDFDFQNALVHWIDGGSGNIMTYDERTSSTSVSISGLIRPIHLAHDWITGNFFLAERRGPATYSIAVCAPRDQSRNCKTIHGSEKRYIGGMAIAPLDGYVFWSSWSPGRKGLLPYGFIRRSNMDGTSVFYVAADKISQPMGLTLDHILRRVYWADAHKGTIEYANWNGNGMAVELKLQKIQIPYSVAVFEASVIWNDLSSSAVLQADRRFRNSTKVLRKKVLPIDIRVRHAAAQQEYPGLDPCSDVQTKNCSHICVLMPNGYVCLCPDGLTRVSDHECQDKLSIQLKMPEETNPGSNAEESFHCNETRTCLNGGTCVQLGTGSRCECLKNYHGPRCAFESTDRETYWRETQGGGDGHVTLDAGGSGGIIAAVILCFILVGLMIVGIYHVRRSEANRLAASLAANRLLRSVQFWSGKDFRLLAHDVLQEAAGASEDEAVHMPANPAECVAPSAMTNNRKRVDGTERVGVNFDNAMSLSPAKPSEFTNQVFGLRQDTRGRGSDGNL